MPNSYSLCQQDPWTMADHCYAKKTQIVHQTELNNEKDNSELLEEAVKEAQEKRQLQCADLMNCMKGSTSIKEHLKAIIIGGLVLAWEPRKEMPTLYFEDEQLDEVVSFLLGILGETPRAGQL